MNVQGATGWSRSGHRGRWAWPWPGCSPAAGRNWSAGRDWPESAAAPGEFGDRDHLCAQVDLRDPHQVADLMARVEQSSATSISWSTTSSAAACRWCTAVTGGR